jgi:hypothetical protein
MSLATVTNRSAGKVVYAIPDSHIRRELAPGQSIRVPKEEIEALSYTDGGLYLIQNYLYVADEELLENLNVQREPEYYMNVNNVVELIKNGSLDEFLDALDFAPEGVVDMIKDLSVQLPLNDYSKRRALFEKTGFDVDAAIAHLEESKANEGEDSNANDQKVRRVQKNQTPGRRTSGAKIIKKQASTEE